MNNLLSQLRDIHLPAPISWWPVALGWYILFVLLMMGVAIGVFCYMVRYRREKYIRLARVHLLNLKLDNHTALTASKISYLLKQVSIQYFPKSDVSKLQGAAWLDFLDRSVGMKGFAERCQDVVYYAYQKPDTAVDLSCLFELSETWLDKLANQGKSKGAPL